MTDISKSKELSLARISSVNRAATKLKITRTKISGDLVDREINSKRITLVINREPRLRDLDRVATLKNREGVLTSKINHNRRIEQAGVDKLVSIDNIQKKQITSEEKSVVLLERTLRENPNSTAVASALGKARSDLATSLDVGRITGGVRNQSQIFGR